MTETAIAAHDGPTPWLSKRGAQRIMLLAVLMMAALILSGCTSRGGSVPYDSPSFGAPDAPSATLQPASTYRIGPLDTLTVVVFRVPELSGDVQVNEMGRITLPLIGEMDAAGKTPDELSANLKGRLGQRFLQDPEVQILVKSSVSQRITVEGSVAQPGIFPIVGRTSLIQAVALARGTNSDANPRRVVIFRQIEGKRQAAAFDLVSIRRGEMSDPEVFGNDIIVVDGSKSRSIFKDVISSIPAVALFRPF